MTYTKPAFCYVASFPGEAGYYAACVDIPAYAKDTAKFVAKCVREGGIVARVDVDEARRGLCEYVPKKRAKSAKQPDLFS